jgi:competence protein ComFC
MNSLKIAYERILDIILPRNTLQYKCLRMSDCEVEDMVLDNIRSISRDHMTALFDYRNRSVRMMIWMLKYQKNTEIASKFATALEHYLIGALSDRILFDNFDNPILIPMPLARVRRRERGFNQVELVAHALYVSNETLCHLDATSLRRIKNTQSQTTTIDKEEREENLRNAFHVTKRNMISDRNIILLDDVITTGSTMNEGRVALLDSGARQVWCVALAH